MKVYVAGGSSERGMVGNWIAALVALGVEVTLDWTRGAEWDLDREPTREELERCAATDLDAIRRADMVWLLVPQLKSEGSAAELGFALALGKTVVVSGEVGARNIFALRCIHASTHAAGFDVVAKMACEEEGGGK